ncbi:MAG: HAMP domain-containing protein, partial [Archangium sp.]|nr:HAMP domain-containing protein [Archangium sp.]
MPKAGANITTDVAVSFNSLIDRAQGVTQALERVSRTAGRGDTVVQLPANLGTGAWNTCTTSVNTMIGEFTKHTQEIARIVNGVAEGDLSNKMTLEFDRYPLQGDVLRVGHAVNRLVDRLRVLSSEVTRVAREVGTEGKLGGQADVKDLTGTWKDLTDNVNLLAGNLTAQVRNIALVTTAVANGDLSQKITVDARGEILELKNTVNTMVEQLRAFA